MPGPMNTGHGDVACEGCHRSAPGTLRQQLQNAARDAVGSVHAPVDIGYQRVDNAACVACHEREDDRHPTFRFLEPRFAEARAALQPESCGSCHQEHDGVRVTVAETTFCRHCHEDIDLEQDPLDISHRALASVQAWTTCLGCHDFHGSHTAKPPTRLDQAIDQSSILQYFAGGPSPYGERKNDE